MTLILTTLGIPTPGINGTQHHNKKYDTDSDSYVECRILYRNAECRYDECRFARCRGAADGSFKSALVSLKRMAFKKIIKVSIFNFQISIFRI